VPVFGALLAGVALPVLHSAPRALVASLLVVGAQPGYSAIFSGRICQFVSSDEMAEVWRWIALIDRIVQGIGGYALITRFEVT
jgi:hypothetical protein